jgi:hypothetical protein
MTLGELLLSLLKQAGAVPATVVTNPSMKTLAFKSAETQHPDVVLKHAQVGMP